MKIKAYFAVLIGVITWMMGGWDMSLQALAIVILLDIISGVTGAIAEGKLNSSISFNGGARKLGIFVAVALANILESMLGLGPMREIVITYYIWNECISICENLGSFIPLPEIFKRTLQKLGGEPDGLH